jgi:hypothetical protein
MGAERWRCAAEPTANGEWRFARRQVRTDRVAPGLALHASVMASSAQWRRRGPRTAGFSGASACACEPGTAWPTWRRAGDVVRESAGVQAQFRLALFKLNFLQKFKQKCSKP